MAGSVRTGGSVAGTRTSTDSTAMLLTLVVAVALEPEPADRFSNVSLVLAILKYVKSDFRLHGAPSVNYGSTVALGISVITMDDVVPLVSLLLL